MNLTVVSRRSMMRTPFVLVTVSRLTLVLAMWYVIFSKKSFPPHDLDADIVSLFARRLVSQRMDMADRIFLLEKDMRALRDRQQQPLQDLLTTFDEPRRELESALQGGDKSGKIPSYAQKRGAQSCILTCFCPGCRFFVVCLCCMLCAVCCVLCAVCCVLCAVFCVLCAVCCTGG